MARFFLLTLAALATALLAAPLAAQTTVSAVGGTAILTGLGGPAPAGGVAVSHALTPAIELDGVLEFARSSVSDEAALTFRSPEYWHLRRHAVLALGATAYPVRVSVLGTGHRLGLGLAVNGRRRADRLHRGTFTPLYYLGRPEGYIDYMASEWEVLGEGYEARILDEPEDGPFGTVAGEHLALIFPSEAWELGASAGLAYELSVGRAALAVRADYRRFLDQRISEGANALDVTVRLGVRF